MAGFSNAAFRHILATIKSDEVSSFVPVGRSRFAQIEPDDERVIKKYKWRLRGAYAAALIEGKLVRMHHYLLGEIPSGKVVDHVNGDGMDNRRSNLRICTPTQNSQNRKATSKPHSSRFKGVSRVSNGWLAQISVKGVSVRIGCFDTEVRAAYEYDRAAFRHHREYAKTNQDLGLL